MMPTGPLLIASHVPVSGHSQIGNHYFENNADLATYPREAARIRAMLRASRVPTAWISGHVHWNTLTTIDGIPHMTQQSLTESFVMSPDTGAGEACGAYGLLKLSKRDIAWRVFGRMPSAFVFRSIKRRGAGTPRSSQWPRMRLRARARGKRPCSLSVAG